MTCKDCGKKTDGWWQVRCEDCRKKLARKERKTKCKNCGRDIWVYPGEKRICFACEREEIDRKIAETAERIARQLLVELEEFHRRRKLAELKQQTILPS